MIKIITLIPLLFIFTSSFCQKNHNVINTELANRCAEIEIENPLNWVLWYNRGECYSRSKDYRSALENYLKAYELHPNDTLLYPRIGISYHGVQNWKKCIEYLQKSVNLLEHDYDDVFFHLGSAYYFNKEYKKAINYLLTAYDLNKRRSGTLNNLGWAYLRVDPEKSCYYFKLAYDIDPTNISNVNNLGYSYMLCGNFERSIYYLEKAQAMEPDNSFIYRNLALYYLTIGKNRKACKNYKKSIELGILEDWGKSYVEELSGFCDR